jgi:hypothetical protein
MGPPISIGNNMTPGPSVNIEDIHNFGPWSAGPSCTGYYVGRVTRIVRSLSLKGLLQCSANDKNNIYSGGSGCRKCYETPLTASTELSWRTLSVMISWVNVR